MPNSELPRQPPDAASAEELLPLVYDELRKLAAARLAHENPGQTLEATALVHEAYLRLLDADRPPSWKSRGHLFAAMAEAMRRILVENARRKKAEKHGGGLVRHDADEVPIPAPNPPEDLLAIDAALDRFAECYPDQADVVKLRYFAGLTIEQTADALGLSPATVKRHWDFSRSWLLREVRGDPAKKNQNP
jgi:RNA polymerase sigma factor (TIGR02999 family)